jgi:anti-sigma regulatory factor (Ser/Thr protein kinase)
VRSLDSSDERLNRVLDVLVRAEHALTLCPDIDRALAKIADAFVCDFGEYCSIEVATDAVERGERCVTAGIRPAEPLDAHRSIVEPLNDGRRTLGRMTCQTSSPDGFDRIVRQAVRLLAMHLAVFLSGQLLIVREQRVADRLQRALLPERLPIVAGAEFHAAYRPASDEGEVGGDWFDAFNLPDHRVAVSVGDVAGHGLDAAVIMGEVRQAIRTAAVAAASPSSVLEHVNRIVSLRDSIGMVTAIFGLYDPAASTLSYAVAGHPAPLLALPDGLVRRLPSGGLPLGCAATVESSDWTFTLPAGSHAVFYTDGLIENERDPIAGELRLLEVVRDLVRDDDDRSGVSDPAVAVQERVFNGASNRDDAAVLLLTRVAPVTHYLFSASPIVAPIARAIVNREISPLDIDAERRFGVLVALGEAVANAIEHAYRGELPGLIRLQIENPAHQLIVTVEDFGRWRPFVRRDERGRGLALMHAFMDSVQILSTRDSTKIVLKAKLAS